MRTGAEADAGRHRHAGQWVLLDHRFQLLSIGAALYKGTSPRGALDVTARNILMPRLRAALLEGKEQVAPARHLGQHWRTWIMPVLGPVSKTPLAVLGSYTIAGAAFPPQPPVVGAWEWQVTPPGPDQRMRTFWSPGQFELYGIPVPGSGQAGAPQQGWWEGPQWLDELILDSDRAEMRRVLDGFIRAQTDGLFIHSYRVRSPLTGEVRRLRLAGRSYTDGTGPDKWFRGISTLVDDDTAVPPPPSTAAVMEAAFAVSADPLCAIDTDYEHIYMTSANFAELGIELPPHRHLPRMVHPEDIQLVRNFLKEAATRPAETIGPVTARLATAGRGGWKSLAFTGTGMRLSASGALHHVLCRVTPAVD